MVSKYSNIITNFNFVTIYSLSYGHRTTTNFTKVWTNINRLYRAIEFNLIESL